MKKIVALSDMHGHLPEIPPCDLLLVAGDLGPATSDYHNDSFEGAKWLRGPFRDWLQAVPARHIVGVGGNHDFILQKYPELGYGLPWIYLVDQPHEVEGIKIYGSPYTVDFCGWAFMEPDELLAKRWARIPTDVQILVTHGPPVGRGDLTEHGQPHLGSASLAGVIRTLPDLKLHVFGHIHESSGYCDDVCANVSHVDRRYLPVNAPYVFEGIALGLATEEPPEPGSPTETDTGMTR